jgi:pimeloyl-ACP methyl ester carboxylesterase
MMAAQGLLGRRPAHTAGVLCLLLCLCACAEPVRSTKLKVPPIGPHHSHGVRQQGLLLGSDRPLVERCKERWRETRLDHFTWHTQHYWEQRYFTCDEFYQPGGPIFFYLGNEADVTLYLNNTGLMWELAPRHHALLVFAEHRFYGQSKPFKPSKLRKQKHMGYLTTEQAMADYATLIWELKEELKDPDAPVIGFGGSYGGMLATWFRLKYPHLLDGAIAASAPIWTYKGEDPPVDPGAFARIVTQVRLFQACLLFVCGQASGGACACKQTLKQHEARICLHCRTRRRREAAQRRVRKMCVRRGGRCRTLAAQRRGGRPSARPCGCVRTRHLRARAM